MKSNYIVRIVAEGVDGGGGVEWGNLSVSSPNHLSHNTNILLSCFCRTCSDFDTLRVSFLLCIMSCISIFDITLCFYNICPLD